MKDEAEWLPPEIILSLEPSIAEIYFVYYSYLPPTRYIYRAFPFFATWGHEFVECKLEFLDHRRGVFFFSFSAWKLKLYEVVSSKQSDVATLTA